MKYQVITYTFPNLFMFHLKTVGFKTKSLYLAKLQANLQKRFQKQAAPIAIVDACNPENIIEWIVPWVKDEVSVANVVQEHVELPDIYDA